MDLPAENEVELGYSSEASDLPQGRAMHDHCIFCKIIHKQVPSNVVYEDDRILAFTDIRPAAPVHVLLIPKEHVDSVSELPPGSHQMGYLVEKAVKVAQDLGLAEKGYRLVVNNGDDGGQTVYHLHLHLLGGRFMTWPPG
jgi:histidine triad (HIT) family protein